MQTKGERREAKRRKRPMSVHGKSIQLLAQLATKSPPKRVK